MSVIEFNDIWEKYRIKFIRKGKVSWEEIWALKDINFNVESGEVLGIIGENGAGKTTLLKLIAGMLIPDRGKINVGGKVSVLMELGAGFNPEFTGRENITLNAKVYGLDENELEEKMDRIIEFAGLGKFIDAPIKYYSQGMYMRLAFALAVFVEPDILLIDDILAVGDEEAQQKCIKKVFALKEEGKTIVLVSHNMNMVNKLCNRVILLEKGKIVQQGLSEDVIPYYLETVGDKRRIAILEKGKLRATFNNGRIILAYNGSSLTKGMGGYVAFFAPTTNSWISSSNLSWQVKFSSEDKFIAEGNSEDGAVSQIWIFQLQNEQILWQVEIKEKAIKEPHLDLVLMPLYKKWITLDKSGIFPPYAYKYNWQDLGLSNCPEGLLGIGPELEMQECPHLILEKEDKDTQAKLFNTGYEQEGRVIQSHLNLNTKNLVSIKIFSEGDNLEKYIKKAKHQFFLKKQAEEARLRAQRTISSDELRLFADLENKVIRIYYKGKEVTEGSGLHSSFYTSGAWLHLNHAQWQIKKISEEKLCLALEYKSLPLQQVFTLICQEKNVLGVKVEIVVNKPMHLIEHHVKLELRDKYRYWLTAYEQGNFLFERYIDDIGPIRLKDSKVSKVLLMPENGDDTPKLFFSFLAHIKRRIINIYKRKETGKEYIGINSPAIVPKKEELVNPGKYTYFEGEIILGKKIRLEEEPITVAAIEFKEDNTRFIFERGRGKIFWKNKELTSGLGLYSSVCSLGIWYDSYQAAWNVNYENDKKIIVTGDWPYLPISQTWHIEMVGKNLILWQVNMEIYEEVNLEIEQANIMLCPEYKNWIVPGLSQGEFLDDYIQDYDISPFRSWSGKRNALEAISRNLPKVIFKCGLKNDNLRAVVENTENLYRSRRIQYQKTNSHKLVPGKYLYFKGAIEIEPKE